MRAQPQRLREPGWWAVVAEFEGAVHAWRFADVQRGPGAGTAVAAEPGSVWDGPDPVSWSSSLDRPAYVAAVRRVREHVRDGDVYQANLCRVLSAPLGAAGREPDARALAARLAVGNPAPYAGGVHVPGGGRHRAEWVVSASPELFLRLDDGTLTSGPIKGTAMTAAGLTAKDRAENVMITDLVRNDLQRVCRPASVEVTDLLAVEQHPGLVHLVSTVQGVLAAPVAAAPDLWGRLLDATYPPGSVSGAPKLSALDVIAALEAEPRGPYCGTVGWVEVGEDGSTRAELAVGIRTFWWRADGPAGPDGVAGGTLRFGTGAGITWGSDPDAEWAETELKASRLVRLASADGAGLSASADGATLAP